MFSITTCFIRCKYTTHERVATRGPVLYYTVLYTLAGPVHEESSCALSALSLNTPCMIFVAQTYWNYLYSCL